MIRLFQVLNYVLSFSLEVAAILAYGHWGFQLPTNNLINWYAGLGLPTVLIVLWSQFFAPKASRRLSMPWLLVGKLIILIGSAAALYVAGSSTLGLLMGGLVILNLSLAQLWGQNGRR